jgi:hypothetical protein
VIWFYKYTPQTMNSQSLTHRTEAPIPRKDQAIEAAEIPRSTRRKAADLPSRASDQKNPVSSAFP